MPRWPNTTSACGTMSSSDKRISPPAVPVIAKKPRTARGLAPSGAKRPRHTEQPDALGRSPLWSFAIADLGGPWCLGAMSSETLVKVMRRLGEFEGMTWTAILQGTGSHPVPVGDLASKAQQRLADIKQDDVDELVSLRFGGRERMWGIRHGKVCRCLWWDPDHEVRPSAKKYT